MSEAHRSVRSSRETIGERVRKHGHTSGDGSSLTYTSWCNMRSRCNNPKATGYAEYGGKGVSHDPRWSAFSAFLEDMGERPSRLHTLDRWPNKSGNYEPNHCRWATSREQRLNQRRTRPVIRDDGKAYPSMLDAALDVGGRSRDIGAVCAGRQKSHRGYGWRIAE